MAPDPVRHPLHDTAPEDREALRRRAIAAHPAGRARPTTSVPLAVMRSTAPVAVDTRSSAPAPTATGPEDGSMTTEYGLLVVVGATIASLVIKWASGGAVFSLLDKVVTGAGRLLGL